MSAAPETPTTPRTSTPAKSTPGKRPSRPSRAFDKRKAVKVAVLVGFVVGWAFMSITPAVSFENSPVQLWVHMPSDAVAGREFPCTVEAWDWSERLSKSYTGEVSFELVSFDETMVPVPAASAVLPPAYRFTGTAVDAGGIPASWFSGLDAGIHEFALTIHAPGYHYVQVSDDAGFVALSNPVHVTSETPARRLVWGDIHTHSFVSDGAGMPGTVASYARDVALLDFYALTDHGEGTGLLGLERGATRANYNWRAVEDVNAPGEFVAFHGVEWTTNFGLFNEYGYGHYTMVYSGNTPLRVSRHLQTTPDALWEALDAYCAENGAAPGAQVIAIPHHLTQTNFEMDWASLNPTYVKTVSVFSVHGAALLQPDDPDNHLGMVHVHHDPTPGSAAADAFQMGIKVALVANSDSHDGHPGHAICHKASHYPDQWPILSWTPPYGHPYPGGLTGAWVDNLTRADVMGALRAGRVVGTRAPYRPSLAFTVNGVPAGITPNSTLAVPTATSPRVVSLAILRDGLEVSWPEAYRDPETALGPRVPAGAPVTGSDALPAWPELVVELWKNSEIAWTGTIAGPTGTVTGTDTAPVTGTQYTGCVQDAEGIWHLHERARLPVDPDTLTTNGEDYYFARAYCNATGFHAWAGPIWVGVGTP